MATLQTQQISPAGTVPSYAAATSGGDEFQVDTHTFLHVKNADSSSHTVTVVTPGTIGGEAIGDAVVAVPATSEKMIGPFDPEIFRGSDGLAQINYSAVVSVTVAAIRC